MSGDIESYHFTIDSEPFHLIVSHSESVLHIFAPNETFVNVNSAGKHFIVNLASHTLIITVNEPNLDLQVSPAPEPFLLSFQMNGYWYGHGELVNQVYPLNRLMLPESPFQTFDNGPPGKAVSLPRSGTHLWGSSSL